MPLPVSQELDVSRPPSLPDVFSSVRLTQSSSFWRRLLGFAGPGFLISVGYMDPGNWATDLAGGSRYGYTLLFVIMLSNLMAILLQSLALKLGVATGRDLAQACRESYSRPTAVFLWIFAEIAIAACDLAEVIGSAIALQLLFHIPLTLGVIITGADVLLILLLQNRGFRYLEALVIVLIGTIGVLFGFEVLLSHPDWFAIGRNLVVPSAGILTNPDMLYIAIGILGATVMPHNLYLHSSIVQTRDYKRTEEGKRGGGVDVAEPDQQHRLRHRADPGALRQCRDPDPRGGGVPSRRQIRGCGNRRRVQAAHAHAGLCRREHHVRVGAARIGSELHHHRHTGRPGGHGGLPPHKTGALAAAAGHAFARHHPHYLRHDFLWRTRRNQFASAQSGHPERSAQLCCLSARRLYQRQDQDGRICQRPTAQVSELDCRMGDRCAQYLVFDRNLPRPLIGRQRLHS
jgi:hypothetical protein